MWAIWPPPNLDLVPQAHGPERKFRRHKQKGRYLYLDSLTSSPFTQAKRTRYLKLMTGGGGVVAVLSVVYYYMFAYGQTPAPPRRGYAWYHWKTIVPMIVKRLCS